MSRTCECGCGASLDGRRRTARYVNRTHGQRAYRKRVEKEMRDRGLEPRVSLRVARSTNPTPKGNGDGPKVASARQASRKRASGMQVSWAKAVETMTRYLIDEAGWKGHERMVRAEVSAALQPALSDKQRARLDART